MQIKTKIVSCHTAYSKPVKQEVISTVILPPLVFPGTTLESLALRSGVQILPQKLGDNGNNVGKLLRFITVKNVTNINKTT